MSDQRIIKNVSPDGSTVTVVVNGVLTIETAGEFRQILSDAMNSTQKAVQLDASQLQSIDITGFQVICSACKTASARNLDFMLEGEAPPCIASFCNEIGASQNIPYCCQNSHRPCILFGGAR